MGGGSCERGRGCGKVVDVYLKGATCIMRQGRRVLQVTVFLMSCIVRIAYLLIDTQLCTSAAPPSGRKHIS